MRLNIHRFCIKKFLESLNRKTFNFVHHFASAVVTFSRITFGVFVGEYGTRSSPNIV